jgi:hypothetical protein
LLQCVRNIELLLKNNNFLINEVLDVTIKFQYNPLKPTRYTRHLYDPTPEQTEDVDCRNWVQIKRPRFLSV